MIYKYLNHLDFLRDTLKERKLKYPSFTQAKLAKEAEIQPTYLSNCLKARANLSSDQCFSLAEALKLDDNETDYLILLREKDHCTKESRREKLLSQIESIRRIHLRTEKNLDLKKPSGPAYQMEYYSDPLNKIVHVLLGIPEYQKDPKKIGQDLQLSGKKVQSILATLEKLELVEFTKGSYRVLQKGFHLDNQSPMTWAHQSLIRMRSIHRLSELDEDEKYSFSATLSASPEAKAQIQAEFIKFLKKAKEVVSSAPAKTVYQINFDLFNWTP